MTFRKPSTRWALWVFAAALLLKSAMPFLASASAQMQRKALVEVCTVYGMSLVASDGDEPAPATDHGPGHAGEHCALSALPALATNDPGVVAVLRATQSVRLPWLASESSQAIDASATWAARLRHGPPLSA